MEFRGPIRRDEFLTRQAEELRRRLTGSGPIFGLSPALRPAEETFGGLETTDEQVTAVQVRYGRMAEVETARAEPGPLRQTLEHHVRLGGDRFADLEWTESATTLRVDGRPVDARMLRAGERWWVVRGERDGLEITVVGRDWHPAEVAVETITDPGPMLDHLRTPPEFVPGEPEPLPDGLRREPHQALADAVVRNSAEQARWLAEGGPQPVMPGYWSRLWQAAVQRQTELSDEPEADANQAVSAMMSQLGTLHHEAEWFRDDDELRRRAVAEVLLYGTGLAPDVPSRAAQEAWHRRSGTGPEDARSRITANLDWKAAWQAWATR